MVRGIFGGLLGALLMVVTCSSPLLAAAGYPSAALEATHCDGDTGPGACPDGAPCGSDCACTCCPWHVPGLPAGDSMPATGTAPVYRSAFDTSFEIPGTDLAHRIFHPPRSLA
ncbi:MAG: hypothetical protein HZB25_06075 [Candidatus Eisenbacteria bacterium]|nr:hypothetical protein [Candidatus Eisenbacteria bacterium]